jgi:hypothetical protein
LAALWNQLAQAIDDPFELKHAVKKASTSAWEHACIWTTGVKSGGVGTEVAAMQAPPEVEPPVLEELPLVELLLVEWLLLVEEAPVPLLLLVELEELPPQPTTEPTMVSAQVEAKTRTAWFMV